jgi:ribulose-phosphate 3-epimerase
MMITPAILGQNVKETRAFLGQPVLLAAGRLHLDVLDSTLFGAQSVWQPADLGPLPPGITLELHLMVSDPQPVVIAWRKAHAGPLHVIYHLESPRLSLRNLQAAQDMGCSCGLALSPNQSLDLIGDYRQNLDEVMLMGVEPGQYGQKFLGEVIFSKLRRLKKLDPQMPLAVDGGVTKELLPRLQEEGVTRVVAFSAIWSHSDPLTAYQDLLY